MDYSISVPKTDLKLCPIGLGTVNAGIAWCGNDANAIFDTYLDCGGNVVDTARVYAAGKSEETIGGWLKAEGKRDRIILITKGGHPKFDSPDDDLHISRMSAADMRSDIECSLRALKTDYIDIYFYHRDNRAQSVEEEIEVMEAFRKEGKIRYYGCSNWETDRIEEADRYCRKKGYQGFVADQALLNFGVRYMNPLPDDTLVTLKDSLYAYHCENSQNLAMPYMGVASGFFHKYLAYGIQAVESSPYYTPGNVMVAERCRELMKHYDASVTQVVLGFFSQTPFASLPLYGPKSPAQVQEALRTLQIPFTKEDFIVEC